ncbi:hypothetical protein L2E82_12349 [Cichorium intybus]|uniref:Uncharacterized protein n=1 Tax=Cichorium intybus TaxID=13427 RepID=A0ACB9GHS8_CICIN|nr:hypothetical protein L2E82_12349 [Cichorium intybus]
MSRNSQRRIVSSLERDVGAGVGALAAALAQLSGFSKPPSSCFLLAIDTRSCFINRSKTKTLGRCDMSPGGLSTYGSGCVRANTKGTISTEKARLTVAMGCSGLSGRSSIGSTVAAGSPRRARIAINCHVIYNG